jgi:hypothetical protein
VADVEDILPEVEAMARATAENAPAPIALI